jgi:ligand-binding sensor domain-containing protein
LTANITTAADLRVTFTTPTPPSPGLTALGVQHLAFSPSGELWVSTYTQFAVFRVESAVVAATGAQTTQATRILYFSNFAQPRGFAFDNSGGLLIAYLGSSFARLSPTQLQSSVLLPNTVTPARVYATGSIVAFAENVVLFPAPATTPLYSRVR